jgi:hypothetical protein
MLGLEEQILAIAHRLLSFTKNKTAKQSLRRSVIKAMLMDKSFTGFLLEKQLHLVRISKADSQ